MKLCVALDLPTKEENLALIQKLKSEDVWLKVGLRSYIRDGEALLREIKSINPKFKIFTGYVTIKIQKYNKKGVM